MLPAIPIDADESTILDWVSAWIRYAAAEGFDEALALLDGTGQAEWSDELLQQLTFDHFDDGRQPRITAPDGLDLPREAYAYTDGTGFSVDHDLPLDGKRSDFTVQMRFNRGSRRYRVELEDIHVL